MIDDTASAGSQPEGLPPTDGVPGLSPESPEGGATEGTEGGQQEPLGKVLRRNKKLGEALKAERERAAQLEARLAEASKAKSQPTTSDKSLPEQIKEMTDEKLTAYRKAALKAIGSGQPDYADVLEMIDDERLDRREKRITGTVKSEQSAIDAYKTALIRQRDRIRRDFGEESLDSAGKVFNRASEIFSGFEKEYSGGAVPPEKHYEAVRMAWEENVTGGKPLAQFIADLMKANAQNASRAGIASPGETVGSQNRRGTGARGGAKEQLDIQALAGNLLGLG